MRFFQKRPRLCAANIIVSTYRKVAGKHATAPAFIARLEDAVEAQRKEQFNTTISLAKMLEDVTANQKHTESRQPVGSSK